MTSSKARRIVSYVVIGLAVAVLIGLIAQDASRIHDARRLLAKRAELVAADLPDTERDLALVSQCVWAGDVQSTSFAGCLSNALPKLTTGPGMYVGVLKAGILLSHYPEDKAMQTLALGTMDRLWDRYRRVDEPSYRMADSAAAELNRSLLYRAFHAPADADTDRAWAQRLDAVELAINDPALATRQRARRFGYESEDALAYQAARENGAR